MMTGIPVQKLASEEVKTKTIPCPEIESDYG